MQATTQASNNWVEDDSQSVVVDEYQEGKGVITGVSLDQSKVLPGEDWSGTVTAENSRVDDDFRVVLLENGSEVFTSSEKTIAQGTTSDFSISGTGPNDYSVNLERLENGSWVTDSTQGFTISEQQEGDGVLTSVSTSKDKVMPTESWTLNIMAGNEGTVDDTFRIVLSTASGESVLSEKTIASGSTASWDHSFTGPHSLTVKLERLQE